MRTKKFEIVCKKCLSKNVGVTLESVGDTTEINESSEWIEISCNDCKESEEVETAEVQGR